MMKGSQTSSLVVVVVTKRKVVNRTERQTTITLTTPTRAESSWSELAIDFNHSRTTPGFSKFNDDGERGASVPKEGPKLPYSRRVTSEPTSGPTSEPTSRRVDRSDDHSSWSLGHDVTKRTVMRRGGMRRSNELERTKWFSARHTSTRLIQRPHVPLRGPHFPVVPVTMR
jgi:hypothetical protein